MKSTRNDFLDVVKFIALFLMLWGHCRTVSWSNSVEYYMWWPTRLNLTFNMALFMVVSGYLFNFSVKKRTLKELLIARSKPLLCTIFSCGILCWFLTTGLVAIVKGQWETLFSAGWLYSFNEFWFLWSVLACSICLAICCKITKKVYLQLLLIILSFGLLLFFPNAKNNVWMYPFFVGGYYYAQYKDTKVIKVLTQCRWCSFLIYPLFFIYWRMEHAVYFQPIYITNISLWENGLLWLFRWGAGFSGSIAALTLIKLIYDLVMKKRKEKKSTLLGSIGKNSLEIYVLSCIFLTTYFSWVIKFIANTSLNGALIWVQNNLWFFNFIFTFPITIAFVMALQMLIVLLGKLKCDKYLFGRCSREAINEKENKPDAISS